jgi:hypothetical protein
VAYPIAAASPGTSGPGWKGGRGAGQLEIPGRPPSAAHTLYRLDRGCTHGGPDLQARLGRAVPANHTRDSNVLRNTERCDTPIPSS